MKEEYTQLEALELLRSMDHAFINAEGVEKITKPFGFKGTTFLAHNTQGPGGLQLDDGLTELEGQDAQVTAMQICDHLKLKYMHKMGRGFQLQECCRVIEEYLTTEDKHGT
jgi:hypothetical protein